MPHLVEIGRQFETRDVELITISTDDPKAIETVGTLAKRFHAAMPELVAASVALAANTSTNTNKKPSGPTPPGGNKTATAEKVATTEKKPKKEAKFVTVPQVLTKEEQERHNITHLQFAAW